MEIPKSDQLAMDGMATKWNQGSKAQFITIATSRICFLNKTSVVSRILSNILQGFACIY